MYASVQWECQYPTKKKNHSLEVYAIWFYTYQYLFSFYSNGEWCVLPIHCVRMEMVAANEFEHIVSGIL